MIKRLAQNNATLNTPSANIKCTLWCVCATAYSSLLSLRSVCCSMHVFPHRQGRWAGSQVQQPSGTLYWQAGRWALHYKHTHAPGDFQVRADLFFSEWTWLCQRWRKKTTKKNPHCFNSSGVTDSSLTAAPTFVLLWKLRRGSGEMRSVPRPLGSVAINRVSLQTASASKERCCTEAMPKGEAYFPQQLFLVWYRDALQQYKTVRTPQ